MQADTGYPSYLRLFRSGELKKRAEILEGFLHACRVCPRVCGVNRSRGEHGFCRSGRLPVVASYCAHFGEEPVLVGSGGSGTIFLGNCNLRCVYCQNHDISQRENASELQAVDDGDLARIMLGLQNSGCHNINFVSPTHFVPQIVQALLIAVREGLSIPLVYNSNGYDSIEVLRLLDGIIDIYLPDIKYSDDRMAMKYSGSQNYAGHSRSALKEMFRQVGILETNAQGIARRGMIIRHLVLPEDIAGTKESLDFIASSISRYVTVSIMSQYHPTHKSSLYPELNRYISAHEYGKAVRCLEEANIENGWAQDLISRDIYLPDFDKANPFA